MSPRERAWCCAARARPAAWEARTRSSGEGASKRKQGASAWEPCWAFHRGGRRGAASRGGRAERRERGAARRARRPARRGAGRRVWGKKRGVWGKKRGVWGEMKGVWGLRAEEKSWLWWAEKKAETP